jgi:hypothetical protein
MHPAVPRRAGTRVQLGDDTLITSVPFQVAYAVSIHKAQGLEYDSVKIVITDANEDDITHSIFYTAVTRARESLKIFRHQRPSRPHSLASSGAPTRRRRSPLEPPWPHARGRHTTCALSHRRGQQRRESEDKCQGPGASNRLIESWE